MTKLNQIIAIEKGVKSQAQRTVTDLYHTISKKPLFEGMNRVYQPKDDEGEKLPPESAPVQFKSKEVIDSLIAAETRLIDITATKDTANSKAKADIVLQDTGVTIAQDVPVTTLIFLEKRLEDLAAFVGRLPVLDSTVHWTYDNNKGLYAADQVQTVRTKKVPRNHVLAEATKEHPAQVQMFTEDIIVGTWTKVDVSGALPADKIAEISSRVEKLREAVKFAREAANMTDVQDVKPGEAILNYIFG